MGDISQSVFISYRTESSEIYAHSLYWELTDKGYSVFFAPKRLFGGVFGPKIEQAIAGSGHFIIILDPNTLTRCSSRKDWVRREIESAMALLPYINIIPFLVGGFDYNDVQKELKAAGKKVMKLRDFNHITYKSGQIAAASNQLYEFIKHCDIPFPKQNFIISLSSDDAPTKPVPIELKAADLHAKAVAWINKGDFETAIALLNKAIELDSYNSQYLNQRGYSYYRLGQSDKALTDYKKALSLNRHNPSPYNNLGILSLEQNDLLSALSDFNIAISLDKNFPRPYFHRAVVKMRLRDFYEAVQDFEIYQNLNGPKQYNNVDQFSSLFYEAKAELAEIEKEVENFTYSDSAFSETRLDDLYYDDSNPDDR